MKKTLKKYRVMSTRDDFPKRGHHIHSLRIGGFAEDRINFTEKESAHYEVCRRCRLKVIKAITKALDVKEGANTAKAA